MQFSLAAASSQESYGHAIDEFIGWYCSEPRFVFNRTVVLRDRFFLGQKNLAPSTINVRLVAVRRLAYEANQLPDRTPRRFAPLTRCIPAASSGLSKRDSGAAHRMRSATGRTGWTRNGKFPGSRGALGNR
jgi:hypothetical protein